MAFPDERSRTYANGMPIPPVDLNEWQDFICQLYGNEVFVDVDAAPVLDGDACPSWCMNAALLESGWLCRSAAGVLLFAIKSRTVFRLTQVDIKFRNGGAVDKTPVAALYHPDLNFESTSDPALGSAVWTYAGDPGAAGAWATLSTGTIDEYVAAGERLLLVVGGGNSEVLDAVAGVRVSCRPHGLAADW